MNIRIGRLGSIFTWLQNEEECQDHHVSCCLLNWAVGGGWGSCYIVQDGNRDMLNMMWWQILFGKCSQHLCDSKILFSYLVYAWIWVAQQGEHLSNAP